MATSSTVTERSPLIGIGSSTTILAVTFAANGEYLVGGDEENVRAWRLEDGEQVGEMAADSVRCLAVSKDGRWIAAGPWLGWLSVWDGKTYRHVFSHEEGAYINGLDFSPDSTRLVTASDNGTAAVWDVVSRRRVLGPLYHQNVVTAAKYSPNGDRVATAAPNSVRVYDSNDGRLLVNIKVTVTPLYNTGVLWSNDQLFIVSDGKIKQVEASTGSAVSGWPVLDTNNFSCIALSQHGEVIACSANRTVTFWDTSTHTELGLIKHTQDIRSIALSPDDQFLAISGGDGKIAFKRLSHITDSIRLSRLRPTFQEPEIHIDDAVLDSWKRDPFSNTETLLTTAIAKSRYPTHHLLALRALVRARLQYWGAAIADAEKSIEIMPSVIGYIAKSVALVSKGEKYEGYRACDIAFERFHSTHVGFILLIKAIVVFMAGEHNDAISRLNDLIDTAPFNSTCYAVQAYMYLLLGNSCTKSGNYQGAVQLFERAQIRVQHCGSRPLSVISLISGWRFDGLGTTICQRLCESLCAAGRMKEGGESLLKMVNTFGEEVYISEPITEWVSDFTRRCLYSPESGGDVASKPPRHDEVPTLDTTLNSLTPTPLLREWAKSTLASGEWKDALVAAFNFTPPRFTIYRVICEHLETVDQVTDAIECFRQMADELVGETDMHGEQGRWIHDFKKRCVERLTRLGDAAVDIQQRGDVIHQNPAPLSLNSAVPHDILILRSQVCMEWELWEDASDDASQVIALDPLSSWGYDKVLVEWARVKLTNGLWRDALTTAGGFKVPRFAIYRALCEHLELLDRVADATECFHEMASELTLEPEGDEAKWILDFKHRCRKKSESLADTAMSDRQYDEAISQYSALLSLNPPDTQDLFIKRSRARAAKGLWKDALEDANEVIKLDPSSSLGHERKHVLMEWAKVKLTNGLWRDAFTTAGGFKVPRFTIYQALCEHLELVDRVVEATECFHEMTSELALEPEGNKAKWILDFEYRCCRKSESLADTAMSDRQYDEAISQYSAALSLDPTYPQALFAQRSKARATKGLWTDALNDANKVIKLDPSSPLGYERKHTALRGLRRYDNAIDAFETMLSRISQSSDPEIHERSRRYVNPAQTKATIRAVIENAIRESPLVLINTGSGRLLDKSGQISSFESQPTFAELVSSMTTHIDHVRIEQQVTEYYRYVMFSHKWEDNEPLFEKVIHVAVYDLEESITHDKLQMFCKIVRDAGFHWAWSDTCCINKADHFVLQEALVSMFKWYQGSAMTIIFLRGVHSLSRRGALMRSIWNTRAWTFQEYHASKVVRFYTEDWTLYLDLDVPNHKESPEIISEMEEATGVSARALTALGPGLDDIREKLRLVSKRQTTRAEDAAYSPLGIFSVSLPVVYGEGDKALGQLLAQLLASSGDTSILAWTGGSGSFNSCLPANITVFSQLPALHIPSAIDGAEMDIITTRLQASALDLTLVMQLYSQLNELPVPLFAGRRMRLPCITFKLGPLSTSRSKSGYIFRAQTAVLGIVEIRTQEDLSQLHPQALHLIHPWVDFLLDRQPVGSIAATISEENINNQSTSIGGFSSFPTSSNTPLAAVQTPPVRPVTHAGLPFGGRLSLDAASLQAPSSVSQTDHQIRALQVIARLRQPFGALLVTPNLGNVSAYRRVAADSLITVQVEGMTPTILNKLVYSVRILDVL